MGLEVKQQDPMRCFFPLPPPFYGPPHGHSFLGRQCRSEEIQILPQQKPGWTVAGGAERADCAERTLTIMVHGSKAVEQENSGCGRGRVKSGCCPSSSASNLRARGHWRPTEDAKLRELVAHYGPQNWNMIAEKLDGRSGKSCRLRWFNQLDPRINRRAFSEEEEERLLAAHRAYGNKWALIARLFPGRTDNAVKNHWHVIMARRQREQQQRQQSAGELRRRKALLEPPSLFPGSLPPPPHVFHPFVMKSSEAGSTGGKKTTPKAFSGESSVTSAMDESASTSTELSLGAEGSQPNWASTHLPGGLLPGLCASLHQRQQHYRHLHNQYQLQPQPQQHNFFDSPDEDAAASLETAAVADPGGYSDSNSEASGAVSGPSNCTDRAPSTTIDPQLEITPCRSHFIDFMGVGAAQ